MLPSADSWKSSIQSLWWKYKYPTYNPIIYRTPEEQEQRRIRFPSIEERVKLYMSNWYTPPCDDAHRIAFAILNVTDDNLWVPPMVNKGRFDEEFGEDIDNQNSSSTVSSGAALYRQQLWVRETTGFDPERKGVYIIQDDITMAQILAIRPDKTSIVCTTNEYCPDTMEYLLPSLKRVDSQELTARKSITIPTMAQFGDSGTIRAYNAHTKAWDPFPSLPHLMKFRFAFEDNNALAAMTASDCVSEERPIYFALDSINAAKYSDYYQPIVWKLTSLRHFSMIPGVAEFDIPYEQKKDQAVFRGALTGIYRDGYKATMKGKISNEEKCMLIHRCRLVYKR